MLSAGNPVRNGLTINEWNSREPRPESTGWAATEIKGDWGVAADSAREYSSEKLTLEL